MTTDIGLCNQALIMVGSEEINSFDDSTREARICSAIYADTKLNILQKYPWNFTLEQIDLVETTEVPLYEYTKSFQIPVNTLRVIKKDGVQNDYRVFKDKLFTNNSSVRIVRQIDPGEENYPSYVGRTIVFKMCELLAAALQQDETMSEIFQKKYNVQVREARSIDSQNSPPELINPAEFGITSVRLITA